VANIQTAGQLAVFSGRPAFDTVLHVGRPNIGDRRRFLERINQILDRWWLSNDGPCVQEFERRIASYIGVRHCVAVCNATLGLELVIRAAGLTGEVIVPSYTFIATAHALQWLGIVPVFCDVDPLTHNLDPDHVEPLITERTSGVLGVHLWGRACVPDHLEALCRRHDLKLLFDAAHAFGCSFQGRLIGGFGHAEVFSFHATKFCNSFEGGAVVTNDDRLAAQVRLQRNFGFAGYDNVIALGTNAKMTEVCAAMGLTSLDSLAEFIAINQRNYHCYRAELAGVPGTQIIPYDERERCNYQYVVVEIDRERASLSRDELLAVLHAENVLARRYFWPACHNLEPYRSQAPLLARALPATKQVADRVLVLPTGSSITAATIVTICQILRVAIANAPVVRERLAERRLGERRPLAA
jgi:dTDP-4-amino-4,6-dideoxygalactose transaminase